MTDFKNLVTDFKDWVNPYSMLDHSNDWTESWEPALHYEMYETYRDVLEEFSEETSTPVSTEYPGYSECQSVIDDEYEASNKKADEKLKEDERIKEEERRKLKVEDINEDEEKKGRRKSPVDVLQLKIKLNPIHPISDREKEEINKDFNQEDVYRNYFSTFSEKDILYEWPSSCLPPAWATEGENNWGNWCNYGYYKKR